MFSQLAVVDVATHTATITSTETLTVDSLRVQKLTPSGGSVDVVLPAEEGNAGLHFTIINASATQNLVVKDDGGSTVMTVLPTMTGVVFLGDDEAWNVLFNSGTYSAVTLTAPTINGAASASGDFDLSGSSGTFLSCTGANTLGGPVTVNDATTPYLVTATGKTNTGYLQVNGKTDGALKLTAADSTAFTVTVTTASQAGAVTLTIPDVGGVSDTFTFNTLAATLSNKTLSAPVISGGLTASGSASNTFAGSTGTFVTSTGANTLSGAVTIAAATTPSLTTASGKTNTGFVQINGKTSGALKFLPADATVYAVTVTTAAQSTGTCTLTIPDFNNVDDTFAFTTLAQTLANKTLTAPVIQVLSMTGTTGNQEIRLTTNLADALSIEDTAGDLIVFDTTTGTQVITITPALTVTGLVTANGGVTLSGAVDLTFSGTTGQPEIMLTANLADALSIKDSTGDLMVFTTTTGALAIASSAAWTHTGNVTMSGAVDLIFSGTTGQSEVVLTTNLADALSLKDSAGDLIVFDTTTGAQVITITPALTVTGAVTASTSVATPIISMAGTTGNQEIRLTTNLADALSIEDTAGDLIVFDTTTGAQRVTITPATTITGALTLSGVLEQSTIAAAVAATGADQAGAAAIGAANITVISSDDAAKGVKLLTGVAGQIVTIINSTATACKLYPASGGTLNGAAANAAMVLPASKGVLCVCTAADTWTVYDLPAKATAA